MRKLNILIAGRSREAIETMQKTIDNHGDYHTALRLITNGHTDPLHGVDNLPDVLVLQHAEGSAELDHLRQTKSEQQIPLIVFGAADDADAIRLAMRAGARDYLPQQVSREEITALLNDIALEVAARNAGEEGSLHVFLNGKGGSGASFLSANVAHGLASGDHAVTLVDLDLQFAGLCRYLDLEPERGLIEALQSADDMDEVSAKAHTCVHESGLRLLSAKSECLKLNADIPPKLLLKLLQIYRSFNDYVVVDLPRNIDVLSATVLENADRILVVMQQTLPHVHDTARLLHILRKEVGVDDSRITIIVNRHVKDSAIAATDIEKALRVQDLVTIPNQYKLTAESINAGLPLSEIAGSTSVTKGLRHLHHMIDGTIEPEQGFLRRALPTFLGR